MEGRELGEMLENLRRSNRARNRPEFYGDFQYANPYMGYQPTGPGGGAAAAVAGQSSDLNPNQNYVTPLSPPNPIFSSTANEENTVRYVGNQHQQQQPDPQQVAMMTFFQNQFEENRRQTQASLQTFMEGMQQTQQQNLQTFRRDMEHAVASYINQREQSRVLPQQPPPQQQQVPPVYSERQLPETYHVQNQNVHEMNLLQQQQQQAQHQQQVLLQQQQQQYQAPPPPPLYYYGPGASVQMPQQASSSGNVVYGATPQVGQQPPLQCPPPPQVSSSQYAPTSDPTINLAQMLSHQSQQTNQFIARQSKNNDLPNFSGNAAEWLRFYTSYTRTTQQCAFSASENVERLRRSLSGKALSLVNSLFLLPNADQHIMKTLYQYFGRPERVVEAAIAKALATPPIRGSNKESIMVFACTVNDIVISVECLQVEAHLHNPQLLKDLVAKLPDHLKLDWGRHVRLLPSYHLGHFNMWLQEINEALSFILDQQLYISDAKVKKEKVFVTSEDEVKEEEVKIKPRQKCPICSGTHSIVKCATFKGMNYYERKKAVEAQRLCYRCFQYGHGAYEDKCKVTCSVSGCGGNHHHLLHRPRVAPTPQSNVTPAPSAPPAPGGPGDGGESERVSTHITVAAKFNGTTKSMLRIIPVKLSGPGGDMVVNALLDEGSTTTLLSTDVADKLGMNGPNVPLSLQWTNGMEQKDNSSKVVSCQIAPVENKTRYQMDGIRTVTSLMLPSPPENFEKILQSASGYLNGVKFPIPKVEAAQILIGSPHIHLTVARSVQEGTPFQPIASKTRLGWTLHGPCDAVEPEDHTLICVGGSGKKDQRKVNMICASSSFGIHDDGHELEESMFAHIESKPKKVTSPSPYRMALQAKSFGPGKKMEKLMKQYAELSSYI